MRRRALAIAVCLAMAASGAVLTAAPAAAAVGNAASVFSLTNTQRTNAGLKPLMSDARLDEAAQAWAEHLASSCTFLHSTASWRASRTVSGGWSGTGENIAAGYTTPSSVITGWMGSAGHKANILNKSYTGLGVGYATSSCSYQTYWVQVFGLSKTARAAGAGDLNGDFDSDVLAQNSSGQLIAYRGSGTGGWNGTSVVSDSWSSTDNLITLGDFTGDGIADVGRIGTDGAFDLLRGSGTGAFGAPTKIGSGWAGFTAVIGGLDFDGDGRTDVLARKSDGSLMLYRGSGKGGWASGVKKIGSGWNSLNTFFYAGDFNGDGRGDVLARRGDGSLWMYPTTGKGTWGTAKKVGSGWGSFNAIFSPGDFDGSGKPDVLARKADGTLMLYRGNGKGGWGAVSAVGTGWAAMVQLG